VGTGWGGGKEQLGITIQLWSDAKTGATDSLTSRNQLRGYRTSHAPRQEKNSCQETTGEGDGEASGGYREKDHEAGIPKGRISLLPRKD